MDKIKISQMTLEVLEGVYEIDKEKSTLDNIVLKKIKELTTYSLICENLYPCCTSYIIDATNKDTIVKINKVESSDNITNLFFSKKDAERLLALRKLINVAKYLNKGTEPDCSDLNEEKYYIYWDSYEQILYVSSAFYEISGAVYFNYEEDAKNAIKILGEDTIKTALGL